MLNMCSHSILLLGKSKVLCIKNLFLLSPLQLKVCSPRNFWQKFDLIFFISFLAKSCNRASALLALVLKVQTVA